ncbi:MAG: hypothetical protein JWM48_1410 [Mycobacterium sp.]|nr:hypothetical protein [Mycobacterium sp.]
MPVDFYARLPRLLQDEFANGRWLPIVGAGLSANAASRSGQRPPTWDALGDEIRRYLPEGYGTTDAVDAISAFEQLHGRPALVDRIHDALLIDEVRPGEVHRAFAAIPFDTVITTNVDFMLEAGWRSIGWPFDPLVGEQRLTVRRRARSTALVKFHGDVHHPNELVLTEADYDGFLSRFPLLATYVASLLITRVPVLIGYSLADPDFRAILQLLGDRLGPNRPAPWVILPKATSAQVARYERRGVRAVVLDKRPNASHETPLAALFRQLAERLPGEAGSQAESSEDQVLAELRLGGSSRGALAVFLGSYEFQAQQRELIFPALRRQGLVPVTPDEVVNAPGLALAGLTQLIRRAAVVIAEVGVGSSRWDELAVSASHEAHVPVIYVGDNLPFPGDARSAYLFRAVAAEPWSAGQAGEFVEMIITTAAPHLTQGRIERIQSRLKSGDTSFAFLEAVISLESSLRGFDGFDGYERTSFSRLLHRHPALPDGTYEEFLRDAYRLRSNLLHRGIEPPSDVAREYTQRILDLIQLIDQGNG